MKHALLDDFDDARAEAEDEGIALRNEFFAAVMAAYTRRSKEKLLEMLREDADLSEVDYDEPGQQGGDPGKPGTGNPDAADREPGEASEKPGKGKGKRTPPRSEAGSGS